MAAPAAARRSWMGPLAGLAAGIGIAALFSHFGMGEGLGNIVTLLLVAGIAFMAIRFLLRRFGPNAGSSAAGMQFAGNAGNTSGPRTGAGSGSSNFDGSVASPYATAPVSTSLPVMATAGAPRASVLPAGFDAAGFERIAKLIFIRMQAANDAADLNDLRTFTTPEMFATVKLDLQERGTSAQQTDVVSLESQVVDVADEGTRQVVSVRFHGMIREDKDVPAVPFDEVWHLVKPADGSREWAIAGIQQGV